MNLTFEKLQIVQHTVTPEVFVTEHLNTVLEMSDGFYLYTWDEKTFGLFKVCVISKDLLNFNPVYKENWHKLIPILEEMKGP